MKPRENSPRSELPHYMQVVLFPSGVFNILRLETIPGWG